MALQCLGRLAYEACGGGIDFDEAKLLVHDQNRGGDMVVNDRQFPLVLKTFAFGFTQILQGFEITDGAARNDGQPVKKLCVLDQVIPRAQLHQFDSDLLIAATGDHNEWRHRSRQRKSLNHRRRIHVRQRVIKKNQGAGIGSQSSNCLLAGANPLDRQVQFCQSLLKQVGQPLIILDNKNRIERHRRPI